MRSLTDTQRRLSFFEPMLKESRKVYQRYEQISNLLDRCPEIVKAIHDDLEAARVVVSSDGGCKYSSDSVLRCLLVLVIEGLSLRATTVRIDTTPYLRTFTRLHDGPVMNYATLDRLKNTIRPETWQQVNKLLVESAVAHQEVSGEVLRVDTTAVETNIHHPTDSTLLGDVYRVLARLIVEVRRSDPTLVIRLRLHRKKVKCWVQKIARLSGKKNSRERMKDVYEQILHEVRRIRDRAQELVAVIQESLRSRPKSEMERVLSAAIAGFEHYLPLADQVLDQAERRVLRGESVPNDQKVFSIFEPHTELLKRGKSWRSIEYGHMIQIAQVKSKLITQYEVFPKRPKEPDLLLGIAEQHKAVFGSYPSLLTTDKGYSDKEKVEEVQRLGIDTAIGRKGRIRDAEAQALERSAAFRSAQAFRAGIEGTIAFLKACLSLRRCFCRGWDHFVSAIGLGILAHNLLNLAT